MLVAFAASVLYNLNPKRAERLLANVKGGKDAAPIVSVPRFLELFATGGGILGVGAKEPPLADRLLAGRLSLNPSPRPALALT